MTTTTTNKFEFGLKLRAENQPHNDRMNDQVDERTNELREFSAGSKRLICELELVRDTLLIDVKETILPKHLIDFYYQNNLLE